MCLHNEAFKVVQCDIWVYYLSYCSCVDVCGACKCRMLMLTVNLQSSTQVFFHTIKSSFILYVFNLNSSLWWGTVSNAFAKSVYMTSICPDKQELEQRNTQFILFDPGLWAISHLSQFCPVQFGQFGYPGSKLLVYDISNLNQRN